MAASHERGAMLRWSGMAQQEGMSSRREERRGRERAGEATRVWKGAGVGVAAPAPTWVKAAGWSPISLTSAFISFGGSSGWLQISPTFSTNPRSRT